MRYDFEKGTERELPAALQSYIPNTYALPPRYSRILNRHILRHSSLLIACQYLYPGDELYVDYRLGPDIPPEYIPSWYGHVDMEGARSRLASTPRTDTSTNPLAESVNTDLLASSVTSATNNDHTVSASTNITSNSTNRNNSLSKPNKPLNPIKLKVVK